MKLIDKDKIVAEIEVCYNECLKRAKIIDSDYWNAKADAYRNVLVIFNDTIEVKEVGLEKEIELVKGDYAQVDVAWNKDFDFIAKHFFELGLKAQKGE